MNHGFQTHSPIDNSIYVERFFATDAQIHQAIIKSQQAQQLWHMTSLEQRAEFCTRAVDALVSKKESLATEISWQMGRPIRFAAGEIAGLEERARYMIAAAKEALSPIQLPEKAGFIRYIQREPLGLVLVIAPWNYPYLTAVNTIIPALMAGNVVLLKHSVQTPLVAERFAEAFASAGLPEGVFQYLHLSHEDTKKLIQEAPINHVAVTGSVEAGEMVEHAAAGRFLNVGLELGGKDSAYVRQDADLALAVETIIDGAFFNSGQSCCGIKRIYVHHNSYDHFLHQAIALTQQYKLGRSDDFETTLGPLVRASAAEFIRGQIRDAINEGAIAHIDQQRFELDKPGSAYLAPQILTKVNHRMRIMREESFGPVVGIMRVSSDAEAISLMNDCDYGLTALVFTQDIAAGIAIGEQLQVGTLFINRCDYLDPALAWTGVKQSGRGCTLSSIGYEALTRPKSFHIKVLEPHERTTADS
jgi:acyl-CoA reductase-like NAD-dependent aldehyde dehydrogenase